jgi:hypothetical protein
MSIDFGSNITLAEAADLIAAIPDNRFLLEGEPGIGKSSIMKTLKARLGDGYVYAYFDCAQKDLGDIAMPSVNREQRVTEYFPNAALQLQHGKPAVIMLDEFAKAPPPVQNMLHPLLEEHNPRLGDIELPAGSIVFLTSNLSTDGVGDVIKGHTLNRVSRVRVAKPDSDQWLDWAINNGIEPVVMAWVRQFPHALASYTDGTQAENPYIYNPKAMQKSYVSPRSLSRASKIVSKRDNISSNALTAALSGTVGEAAARDMQAYIAYQDQLPSWDLITNKPKEAPVPTSAGASAVLIFGAIMKVAKDTMQPFMTYLERFEPEWQACFAINIAKNPQKQSIAFSSSAFANWVQANEDLL